MSSEPLAWQLMADAAAALGVSIRTLQRRIVAGELTSRKDQRGRVEVQVSVADLPDKVAVVHAMQNHAAAHKQQASALAEQVEFMRSMVDGIRADARSQVRAWQLVAAVAVVAAVVFGAVSVRNSFVGVTHGQMTATAVVPVPDVLERGGQAVVVDDDWQGVPFR